MTKRKLQPLPTTPSASSGAWASLHVLDRFSEVDLKHWRRVSSDLDELNNQLYFGVEPQRRRHQPEMLAALQSVAPVQVAIKRWVRNVSFRFSNSPLSAAGTYHDLLQRYIDHHESIEFRQTEIARTKFPLKLVSVAQVDSKLSPAVQLAVGRY